MKKKASRQNRMISLAILVILLIIILNSTVLYKSKSDVTIHIADGSSTSQIAANLKENKVIGSKIWFMLKLTVSPYRGKLKFGKFDIAKGDSTDKVIETLATKGAKKDTYTLTIPEGYSVEQICDKVASTGHCSKAEFEQSLKKNYNYPFLQSVPNSKDIKYRLQGFLYPSTYEFYNDATAETIITTMLDEFSKQISRLNIPDSKIYETVTKASMIEREAKIASERRTIAGVIENRLSRNMPLQIDATVAYAISGGLYNITRVYYKDLENSSKYNTYKYKGLPAGPICNPRADTISAAANPQKHNYLYYHTDTSKKDGSHIFTETYQEHTNAQK
ncbi:MAG: endolytic transglycosylase MltG [Firmicutes bacterium]|nr:endolytic transglycosylase MltG [Bacillota bacterium]